MFLVEVGVVVMVVMEWKWGRISMCRVGGNEREARRELRVGRGWEGMGGGQGRGEGLGGSWQEDPRKFWLLSKAPKPENLSSLFVSKSFLKETLVFRVNSIFL
jgi:hypothetical protein